MIGDEYLNIEGHNSDADMGLGCGIPTEFAQIKSGDTVVDLAQVLETIVLWRGHWLAKMVRLSEST